MKKRIFSIVLTLCLVLTLMPTTAFAAGGSTKTINCDTFTLEISNVYAIDNWSKSAADGYFTNYIVVVPAGATIKCSNMDTSTEINWKNRYYRCPFNSISFPYGLTSPIRESACDYDDAVYREFTEGSNITVAANNEYAFTGGSNYKYKNVMILVLEPEDLVQFGGTKPKAKDTYSGNLTATPSNTQFVVNGKKVGMSEGAPQVVTQAYSIGGTNYLQLRAIAVLLNRTSAQFDVGWDGQYAVIEPGKAYSDTVIGSKMQITKNVKDSTTKFKLNGEVFSFSDAKLINGSINYIQLREFAQKLSGTASQFNIYWDSALGQAIVQPGVAYTGTKSEEAVAVLEQVKTNGEPLPDGDYYLQIFGKYLYPVKGGQYWLELKSERPPEPFTIKRAEGSSDKDLKYSIAYGTKSYIMLPGSIKGAQLQSTGSSTPHYWKIEMDSDFGTIKDYLKQDLIVNSSGRGKSDGTKVIGWTVGDTIQENEKITFLQEVGSGVEKTEVQVTAYPSKVKYKVGEGFDGSGVKAAIKKGSSSKDVSDEVTFYTSKTVQLTQGRPFETTGKKVVEVRYNGDKVSEYTINVTK